MKGNCFLFAEIILTVSVFITSIFRFKFFQLEKIWLLLSIICTISALVGALFAREISTLTKKIWFNFLFGIIMIVIVSFLLVFMTAFVPILTSVIFYIIEFFSEWLIVMTLVIPLLTTEKG